MRKHTDNQEDAQYKHLADRLLKHLYEKREDIHEIITHIFAHKEYPVLKTVLFDFEDKFIKRGKDRYGEFYTYQLTKEGIELMKEHGSYSSFVLRERTAARTQSIKDNFIKIAPLIVAAVVGSWGIYQDVKNDRLETEKSDLQRDKSELLSKVDSLTKEIEAFEAPEVVVDPDSSTTFDTPK